MKKLCFFLVITLFLLSGCGSIEKEMEEFAASGTISTPDLGRVPNGTYRGGYRSGVVRARVQVRVENRRITDIRILRHFHGQGKAAEAIIEDVLAAQKLEVDMISGATYSSKVILKALERALTVK